MVDDPTYATHKLQSELGPNTVYGLEDLLPSGEGEYSIPLNPVCAISNIEHDYEPMLPVDTDFKEATLTAAEHLTAVAQDDKLHVYENLPF